MERTLAIRVGTILALIIGIATWEIISLLRAEYPITNWPPKGTTVVALGDSLTEGVGASSPEKGFVSVLSERLGVPIANKGRSGDTVAMARARMEDDILPLHPDITLILLGGNDIIRRTPTSELFAELNTIIRRVQSSGSVVIVVGVNGILGKGHNDDFERLAKETGSIYVPDILDGILGTPTLMADEIHPNDAGYAKVADRIAPILEGVVRSALRPTDDYGTGTVRISPSSE